MHKYVAIPQVALVGQVAHEVLESGASHFEEEQLVVAEELLLGQTGDVEAGPLGLQVLLEDEEVGVPAHGVELAQSVSARDTVLVVLAGGSRLEFGRTHCHADLHHHKVTCAFKSISISPLLSPKIL